MKILFLDQNKWIDIARSASNPSRFPKYVKLYHQLTYDIESGKLIIPLTMSHIIETSKKNDLLQRRNLAKIQSELSKGLVFRSRKSRLTQEIQIGLRKAFGEPAVKLPDMWFIAEGFMQAFEEFDDYGTPTKNAERNKLFNSIAGAPNLLYDFLIAQNNDNRLIGIIAFSEGSEELVKNIEIRRQNWKSESRNIQGKAHSVFLFHEHQDLIISQLQPIGHNFEEFKKLGDSAIRAFFEDIPTLKTEKELVVKLESQSRNIHSNDLRDMYSFCAAIPYADWLISENTFVTLAKQAKLDSLYKTKITTNLSDLSVLLDNI
jgi:hypothetical protein